MNNPTVVVRSLLIYGLVVPLAIFIGYLLAKPIQYSTLAIFAILAGVMAFPLMVRWHFPLLLFTWSMPCILIFLKGQPHLWLAMVVLTLGISILEQTLNREKHFIYVKEIVWPLMCLVGVVVVTANLTGGFGLRALGSNVYGGKKYIFLFAAILAYFALTSRAIPRQRALLYVSLFFLGGLPTFIGDLYPIIPRELEFIFWFFPPTGFYYEGEYKLGVTRLGGVGASGIAVFSYLMARYGIRGIFMSSSLWRPVVFCVAFFAIFLGGFRSALIFVSMIFAIQFFMEGLHRTRLVPMFVLGGILASGLVVAFSSKLPFTFQRTLAFLPLQLDPAARRSAADSSEWRKQMWVALLPQVGQYFFIGKGYAISMEDWQMMGMDSSFRNTIDASQQGLALSGDYHNGPLSVIIPFAIWGLIAVLWFIGAGLRVLYCNFRYGDDSLRTINMFLFINFVVLAFFFLFIGGALTTDIARMIGPLGLSIALNHGVRRRPVMVEAEQPEPAHSLMAPPRPSFQR